MTTARPEQWPVPVDPRLRARRRAVRRSHARRRLRRLGLGAAGAGIGLVAWALALSPLLDVDRVVVEGAHRSGAEVVRQVADVAPGQAMVTLGMEGIAADVETLPWVATATVERRWPGTVAVTVIERRPVAAVSHDRPPDGAIGPAWMLVDDEGRRLAAVETPPPELPTVEGGGDAGAAGQQVGPLVRGALELAGRLQSAIPGPAPRVVILPGGALQALLRHADGTDRQVEVGAPTRLADKVLALRTLLERGALEGAGPEVVVDVRVPEAPVLTGAEAGRMLSTATRGLHNSKSQVEVEGLGQMAGP